MIETRQEINSLLVTMTEKQLEMVKEFCRWITGPETDWATFITAMTILSAMSDRLN